MQKNASYLKLQFTSNGRNTICRGKTPFNDLLVFSSALLGVELGKEYRQYQLHPSSSVVSSVLINHDLGGGAKVLGKHSVPVLPTKGKCLLRLQ